MCGQLSFMYKQQDLKKILPGPNNICQVIIGYTHHWEYKIANIIL